MQIKQRKFQTAQRRKKTKMKCKQRIEYKQAKAIIW